MEGTFPPRGGCFLSGAMPPAFFVPALLALLSSGAAAEVVQDRREHRFSPRFLPFCRGRSPYVRLAVVTLLAEGWVDRTGELISHSRLT